MYLRVSLTDRCNLRCRYCLPEAARFGPDSTTRGELQRLTTLVHHCVGLTKIRLTGGEPTLNPDLIDHVRHARALVPTVGMTTNGLLLEPLLVDLRAAGLSLLNISLDAVDAAGFRRTTRRDGVEVVISAIHAARRAGFDPLKVNAVALPDTDYPALVGFAIEAGIHLRFIELMAIGEARPWQASSYVAAEAMRGRLFAGGYSLIERCDHDQPTSRVWQIDDHDPANCSVGFITTVSAPFCATCDRLRLSSRGRLFTCLMDNQGVDLLAPLRDGDDTEVMTRIRTAVAGKQPPEQFVRHEVMAAIGG